MLDNYLKIKPILYKKTSEIEDATANITMITQNEQTKECEFPNALKKSIHQAFLTNKAEVFTIAEDQYHFIAIIPEQEIEEIRNAGALVYKALSKKMISSAIIKGLHPLSEEKRLAFLEGMLLSSYCFTKHKTKAHHHQISVYISINDIPQEKWNDLICLVNGVSITKNLVNEPLNYMDALTFAETAKTLAKKFGFEAEAFHKKKIEDLKMGGLLAVNRGSETPPTFNIFRHQPEHTINKNPIVLIGKGVMFDTGGYSLKVGGSMSSMKDDMAGGASVLGIICAIAAIKLPYYVIGLVPATDNKIAPDALVVDDIITMMDGTTVEIQNTDAEGRLVLADALTYAKSFNPELVIDIATLTGASAAITGSLGIAMAGNTLSAMDKLQQSGDYVYERLFQLPFWKEYKDMLQSDIADLKNVGGPIGGASTAAKFLEHFTDYPWIHLDIAGAAFLKAEKGYQQVGATAISVRLLYHFIKNKCFYD
nr:leucyl aminopeptidase [uncultured Chryseobacterium sp.]